MYTCALPVYTYTQPHVYTPTRAVAAAEFAPLFRGEPAFLALCVLLVSLSLGRPARMHERVRETEQERERERASAESVCRRRGGGGRARRPQSVTSRARVRIVRRDDVTVLFFLPSPFLALFLSRSAAFFRSCCRCCSPQLSETAAGRETQERKRQSTRPVCLCTIKTTRSERSLAQ